MKICGALEEALGKLFLLYRSRIFFKDICRVKSGVGGGIEMDEH